MNTAFITADRAAIRCGMRRTAGFVGVLTALNG